MCMMATYKARDMAIVDMTQTAIARVQYSLLGKGRRRIRLRGKDDVERGGSLAVLVKDSRNDGTASKRSSC